MRENIVSEPSYLIESDSSHEAKEWFKLAAELETNQTGMGVSLHLCKAAAEQCDLHFNGGFIEYTHDKK